MPGAGRRRSWAVLAVLLVAGCAGSTPRATPGPAPSAHRPSGHRPSGHPPGTTTRPGTTSRPGTTTLPARVRRVPTGRPVTLAFGGDVHFEGSVRRRLLADPATTLEPVASLLRGADLAMVNLETPVTDRGVPEPKQFVFRAPASAFTALKAGGVDVVTVANNHGEDYGLVGLGDTLRAGRAAGMPVVGAGADEAAAFSPWRTTIRGQRIAVIGATQVLDDFAVTRWAAGPGKPGLASAKHAAVLLDAVRRARADSDTVVVYLHWGVERQQCPQVAATALARQLVAAGADVVVGSHAHVLVGAGYLGGAYVDYGLGNFVFYASGSGPATTSGVLTLTTRGHAVVGARWSPAVLHDGTTSPVTGPAAVAAIRARDALRSCAGLAAQP